MKIIKNYSLKNNNTFRVDVKAKYFAEINSHIKLKEVFDELNIKDMNILILGDGANVLFTKDFEGLVLKVNIKGINVIEKDGQNVVLEAGAGEEWDKLVRYSVEKNYGGIENMAMIPGTVGAAAAGNIAAYNQNLIDVFEEAEAINLKNFDTKIFYKKDCKFAYRESIFKNELKNKFLITKVRIKLTKNPKINSSYFETGKSYKSKGYLEEELSKLHEPPYTVKDIYNAVSSIRKQKLPDPKQIGTAGSFFKNPVVSKEKYNELKKADPDLQSYPAEKLTYVHEDELNLEEYVKIPAARLFDNLGWKGKRIGNVGTYPTQAINIVSYDGATGNEILEFAEKMEKDFYDKYGIKLEREVVII